jgi:Fe-S-cluster containining protein
MSRLSNYCIATCGAKCCKRGELPLLPEEAKLFDKKRINNKNHYDLTGGCEFLVNNCCSIYDKRPQMCKEYPFHHFGPKIIANIFCEAVEIGLLDEEIEEKKAKKI